MVHYDLSSDSSSCYYYGGNASASEAASLSDAASLSQDASDGAVWYYAVAVGRETGIFADCWGFVERLTKGFPGALFKKFAVRADAERFLFLRGVYESAAEDEDWYYAVGAGRVPGIYTHAEDALEQTCGFSGARMRKFARFWEAEAFLARFSLVLENRCAFQDSAGDRHWYARDRPWHATDPKDPASLVAFCHGSALRNGSQNASVAFACVFPHRRDWDVVARQRKAPLTNNRAEFNAVIAALRRANAEDPDRTKKLFVFTNSQLLIDTVRSWMYKWSENGWRKENGQPVKNQDLIKELLRQKGSRPVELRHVRAHIEIMSWESHWSGVAESAARNHAHAMDKC